MGGRPTVVGLLAVAVAVFLTSAVAVSPATAEFRIPGLFEPKPKTVHRKQVFRPTMPRRNPSRVTAGVSAAAVSPEVADKSEAAVVAGTASSASVALALAPSAARAAPEPADPEPAEPETSEPESASAPESKPEPESASAPEDAPTEPVETADAASGDEPDATDSGADENVTETAEASDDPAETEETARTDEQEADEPAETADADADAPAEDEDTVESAENDTEPDEAAGSDSVAEAADDETVTAAASEEAETDSRPTDAKQGDADAEVTPDDTAETETDETPAEIAAVEPPAPDDAGEQPEAMKEAGQADAAPEEAETEETVTAAIAEVAPENAADEVAPEAEAKPVEPPAHDASVVLDVSPPPDDLRVAAAAPEASSEDAEASDEPAEPEVTAKVEEDENAEEKAGDKIEDEIVDEKVEDEETKVAALTPPSAPASPAPEEEETSEPAALDTAPSDDEKVEDENVEDEKVETEDAAPAADAESADGTGEDEATAEEAGPPPPPPAHPVVAAIRAKLEEPGQFKGASASDLKALTELYGARTEPPLWVTDSGVSPKAEAIMAEIRKADDWGLEAGSFDLPSTGAAPLSEDAQAEAEIKLSIAILSYARDAQIGRLSPSGVSKLFDQHPSLRDPKKVLTEMEASDTPDRYLLSLHPQHDQFKRLQQALVRARDSAKATGRDPNSDRKVQLLVINMERWRWLPRDMGNYHVWNNVPEFNVRVMKAGQPIYQEKTIVGQYQYATPFFSAPMRNIVFHPNWTVPPTIIKEDLAPKLQGPGGGGFFGSSKEAVLRRYGLSANYKGKKIDADTVDWNNVNIHSYTFTQDPGPANVLGQFKFNFPNKHAIYMHDTPQRELFAERTRTLSHGCIRVNQPDRLAALLLSEDKGWSMGQVRNLVDKGPSSSTVIALNRHVPVHLTYFTAIVGESGQVTDFGDIYGIDNRMAPKLFKNPAHFPVPATPAVAEEGSSSRAQAQTERRRSGGGFDNFISGLFGN
jgi:murein L,D-transpeptidase YcbB/YkuD